MVMNQFSHHHLAYNQKFTHKMKSYIIFDGIKSNSFKWKRYIRSVRTKKKAALPLRDVDSLSHRANQLLSHWILRLLSFLSRMLFFFFSLIKHKAWIHLCSFRLSSSQIKKTDDAECVRCTNKYICSLLNLTEEKGRVNVENYFMH